MLNSIRNFSKTFAAKIFLFIVAIPFVFWGMGDVFTSGNTNNLAKINKTNLSTQDFIEYINKLNIDQNIIKDRIDDNILEEILGRLISNKLIELEIKEAKLIISDKTLAERIKMNPNFIDDDGKFSRTKYEKFLLSKNLNASEFEKNFRENEFQDELFNYLGGGVKSPNFLINNVYEDENKQIEVEFINLEKVYLQKESIKKTNIQDYVNKNKDKLKKDFIDFSYSKVTPKNLIGIDEYNNEFFNKIDEIETSLLNNSNFVDVIKSYNLETISKNNFIPKAEGSTIESKIYKQRKAEQIGVLDEGDFFIVYEIRNIDNKLPSLDDVAFENQIKELIFNSNKFEFNKKILKKIYSEEFLDTDFKKIGSNDGKIDKLLINSKNDVKKFTSDSLEVIYSLPPKSFTLVADNEKNVHLLKILNHKIDKKLKNSELKNIYTVETDNEIKNKIFQSYNIYLNSKYSIKINEKTLDRVKNYFR